MKCQYGQGSRGYCGKEVIAKATDAYGTNYYCEKHLDGIRNLRDVTIVLLVEGET